MKQISPSLTSKLRSDSVVERDYIVFSEEEERHYIWFDLYDDCYNNGNFIGTFVMKRIEFTYKDNDLEFKQKEFNAYKEYKLDDGTWESINYGTFIVQSVEESDTKEEIKVTAYDYTLKFANTYVSDLDYASGTITLLQVLQECCTKCGVELATTDFANSGFLVDSNQFDGLSMFGNVVSAVAGISCNFAKIKADNKLYLEFKNETGIVIDVSDYEEFDDKRDTQPYNAVSLGMSAVEGENVTLVDEGVEPGKENYLTINDNPFAYTQKKRNELIQEIFDKINGFGYSSFELDNCMYPQLECGDLIQIRNKEGQLVDTIVLRLSYKETEIKLEAPSTINATVKYENPPSAYDIAKLTQITVDKELGLIKQEVIKINTSIEEIEKSVEIFVPTIEPDLVLVPTFDNGLPKVSTEYFVEYSAKLEGSDVTPTVTTTSENEGITLAITDKLTFAVNSSVPIPNKDNKYELLFSYTKDEVAYTKTMILYLMRVNENEDLSERLEQVEKDLNNNYPNNEELEEKLEGQKATIIEETSTMIEQSASEVTTSIINKVNTDGVTTLKNTLVTIDINGINVAKNDEDVVSLLDNKGLYVSDGKLKEDESNLLMKTDRNGAYFKSATIDGTIKEQGLFQKEVIEDDDFGKGQAGFWIGG